MAQAANTLPEEELLETTEVAKPPLETPEGYLGMRINLPTTKSNKGALRHSTRHIEVSVEVIDERVEYGHQRLLVRPVGGAGEVWVNADRLVKRRGATLAK